MPDVGLLHRVEEVEQSGDVVGVVLQRAVHGIPDGLVRREMNDDVDVMVPEDLAQGCLIGQIDVVEGDVPACDALRLVRLPPGSC